MAAPCRLPLLWLRVIIDHLAGWGRGEVADRALHPIALTRAVFRGHVIIINRLRLQLHQANPENRLWMGSVEPDVTFRRLAQILGIRPVMHDAVMFGVSARVGAGPPDNHRVVVCNFELWLFGDRDVLSPLLRRKDLSDDWVGEEQAAGRGGDRQFEEQSIHRTDPQLLFPWETRREVYGGRALPPYTCLRPTEPGVAMAPAEHCRRPSRRGIG